jgi:hypothetical protein
MYSPEQAADEAIIAAIAGIGRAAGSLGGRSAARRRGCLVALS